MVGEFWLSDRPWAVVASLLPQNQAGAWRVDHWRIISGILHVLRSGCRWKDCPAVYGPSTTVYNRWNRWSGRGIWMRLFDALAGAVLADVAMIDNSAVKVQRASAGGKGGRGLSNRPLARRPHQKNPCHLQWSRPAAGVPAQPRQHRRHHRRPRSAGCRSCRQDVYRRKGFDATPLRNSVAARGTRVVILNYATRRRPYPFDANAYRDRNLIKRMFCQIKGLATHRHTLKQTGQKLRLNRRIRGCNHLVDLIESRPCWA